MSLTSILNSLQAAIDNAYDVIAAKGVTLPTNKNTDELADAISAIAVSASGAIFGDPDELQYDTANSSDECDAILFYVPGKNSSIKISSYNASGTNTGTIYQYTTSGLQAIATTNNASANPGTTSKVLSLEGATSGTSTLVIYGLAYASPGNHIKVTGISGNAKYLCLSTT